MFKVLVSLSSLLALSNASGIRGLSANVCAKPSSGTITANLGNKLVLSKPSKVEITYCTPTGTYSTDAYAIGPNKNGNEKVFLGNTKTTPGDTKIQVGAYDKDREVVLSISIVGNVPFGAIGQYIMGKTYYSGAAERNHGNKRHASIVDQGDGRYWVGFEDTNQCNLCSLFNNRDYDDVQLSVQVTELPPCENGVYKDLWTNSPTCECKQGFEANALWAGLPGSDSNKCLAKCGWEYKSYQSGEGVCECVWGYTTSGPNRGTFENPCQLCPGNDCTIRQLKLSVDNVHEVYFNGVALKPTNTGSSLFEQSSPFRTIFSATPPGGWYTTYNYQIIGTGSLHIKAWDLGVIAGILGSIDGVGLDQFDVECKASGTSSYSQLYPVCAQQDAPWGAYNGDIDGAFRFWTSNFQGVNTDSHIECKTNMIPGAHPKPCGRGTYINSFLDVTTGDCMCMATYKSATGFAKYVFSADAPYQETLDNMCSPCPAGTTNNAPRSTTCS